MCLLREPHDIQKMKNTEQYVESDECHILACLVIIGNVCNKSVVENAEIVLSFCSGSCISMYMYLLFWTIIIQVQILKDQDNLVKRNESQDLQWNGTIIMSAKHFVHLLS